MFDDDDEYNSYIIIRNSIIAILIGILIVFGTIYFLESTFNK